MKHVIHYPVIVPRVCGLFLNTSITASNVFKIAMYDN
jgi:hypothetical protein